MIEGERERARERERGRKLRQTVEKKEKIVIKPERNRPPRGGDPAFTEPETMLGT